MGRDKLIAAAQHLAEGQRLTAEGKFGEAGRPLEALKRIVDKLSRRRQGTGVAPNR